MIMIRLVTFILALLPLFLLAQKRELKGTQTYWEDAELPLDEHGRILFKGAVPSDGSADEIYSRAINWISINNYGPQNKFISRHQERGEIIFQRSFNYYFEAINNPSSKDNQIISYHIKIVVLEGSYQYHIYNFRHDYQTTPMNLVDYLELTAIEGVFSAQIKSQVIIHIEGYLGENGEQEGFIDRMQRVLNYLGKEEHW